MRTAVLSCTSPGTHYVFPKRALWVRFVSASCIPSRGGILRLRSLIWRSLKRPDTQTLPPFRLNTSSPASPRNRHWGSYPGLTCSPVSLRLNRDEQFFLSLSADRARVKLGSPKVKLRGHVMLRSHTGERLSAEEMHWDQQNKVLEVEGAYVLARPHAEQRGSNASFIVDQNGALKHYPGNPRVALGETS